MSDETDVRNSIRTSVMLAGLAIPLVGLAGPAVPAPQSPWEPIEEEFSEEFEACPGVNVLWELTVTGKSRWTTRGQNELPLYQEHVTDTEVYTNQASDEGSAWCQPGSSTR